MMSVLKIFTSRNKISRRRNKTSRRHNEISRRRKEKHPNENSIIRNGYL